MHIMHGRNHGRTEARTEGVSSLLVAVKNSGYFILPASLILLLDCLVYVFFIEDIYFA